MSSMPHKQSQKSMEALYRGARAHQSGNLADAEFFYKLALTEDKRNFDALHMMGILYGQVGNYGEAVRLIESAIKLNPRSAEAYVNLGRVQFEAGEPARAAASYVKALAIKPDFVLALTNYSAILRNSGKPLEALAQCDRALALQPNSADAINNRGNVLFDLQRYDEALAAHDQALALVPQMAEAWLGRGNACVELKRYDDALAAYGNVLAQKPDATKAWLGNGNALAGLVRFEDALASFDRALALDPELGDARLGRGYALTRLARYGEALAEYDLASAHKPDVACLGRGNVFAALRRYDDAQAAIEQAIALNPNLADAWCARGLVLGSRRKYAEAVVAYEKALSLKPDLEYVEGHRLHARQQICDWADLDLDGTHLLAAVERGETVAVPFVLLGIPSSPADQLMAARLFIAREHPAAARSVWQSERYDHDRINIAYLSADFRDHPVAYLLAGLFERHDRTRFQTIAISFGPDEQSATRERLSAAFDRFIEVDSWSDLEVAGLMRELEVDIAIDLTGFTQFSRTGILALRPAPVQVSYLGYAGTLGADYVDYIIADRGVIPPDRHADYAEKPVYLPDAFMGSDDTSRIGEAITTRAEAGLPDDGFVFCCFNQVYKIMPDVFDIWMRLLGKVDGSVLWLQGANADAVENLRAEAEKRGIAGDRLVFAERVADHADHLGRHRLADLFLDTLPYNAHTAANEALWTGLPVVTRIGTSFAGRVAASLLQAVGLPELVTTSAEEYEALALKLATDRDAFAAVKAKLAANRTATGLFDTDRFRRHIEAAYTEMHRRHQAGEPPASFAVEAITST